MMRESAHKFIKIISKIPMFQGLTPSQALEVLKAVEPKAFSPKQMVCEAGSKSTEMYILLVGQLAVRSRDGMPLATIDPIVTVGEMGLITGHARSATVVAVKPSNALMLSKMKFEVLLRKSPDLGLTIYRNVILTLTDRISENNRLLSSYQRQLESLKHQLVGEQAPESGDQEEEPAQPAETAPEDGSPVQEAAGPEVGEGEEKKVLSPES